MNPNKTVMLFGPPGTGKTTALIKTIIQAVDSGIDPQNITFVSFTRKAAYEARDRALAERNWKRLPTFRTLHSLAFHELSLSSRVLMNQKDYFKISKALGINIPFLSAYGASFDEDQVGGRIATAEQRGRSCSLSPKKAWEQFCQDSYWEEFDRYRRTLREYKDQTGKYDYTDLLSEFEVRGSCSAGDILMVDEVQDLSDLQWRMVEKMGERYRKIFLAGDDDQAIFKWAGANPQAMLSVAAEHKVLPKSYRLPKVILDLASSVSARIKERKPKDFNPADHDGAIIRESSLHNLPLQEGRWLLLARNRSSLDHYRDYCDSLNIIYDDLSEGENSVVDAILTWENLRQGSLVTAAETLQVYQRMDSVLAYGQGSLTGVRRGCKTMLQDLDPDTLVDYNDLVNHFGLKMAKEAKWYEAMTDIPIRRKKALITAWEKKGAFDPIRRIKISTIHSIKGGEADNVALLPDMGSRTWKAYKKDDQDENRVWYVAITRAKRNLFLLNPLTSKYYPL